MTLGLIFFFVSSLIVSSLLKPENRVNAFIGLAVAFFFIAGKSNEILAYISLFCANVLFLWLSLKKSWINVERLKFFSLIYAIALMVVNNSSVKAAGWSYLVLSASSHIYDLFKNKDKIVFKDWVKEHFFLVSSFPRSLMGPIDKGTVSSYSHHFFKLGSMRFIKGLIKVTILLQMFRVYVPKPDALTHAFFLKDLESFFFLGLWHYVDLYLEFSGAIDMVIGIYLIWGFELKENFNRPWLATSITDFWRRWHMTLGKWILDHVYIPLGGNRHGMGRQIIHLILAMGICGLWHGRTANFLLWGIIQGIGLAAEKLLWSFNFGFNKWFRAISWLTTQVFVVFSWVVFFNWT